MRLARTLWVSAVPFIINAAIACPAWSAPPAGSPPPQGQAAQPAAQAGAGGQAASQQAPQAASQAPQAASQAPQAASQAPGGGQPASHNNGGRSITPSNYPVVNYPPPNKIHSAQPAAQASIGGGQATARAPQAAAQGPGGGQPPRNNSHSGGRSNMRSNYPAVIIVEPNQGQAAQPAAQASAGAGQAAGQAASQAPQAASQAPQAASQATQAASQATQAASQATQAASQAPQTAAPATQAAAKAPQSAAQDPGGGQPAPRNNSYNGGRSITRSNYPVVNYPAPNQGPTPVHRPGGYNHYDPTAFIPREAQPGGQQSSNFNSPGLSHQRYARQDNAYAAPKQNARPAAARVQPGAAQMYSSGQTGSYAKSIRF